MQDEKIRQFFRLGWGNADIAHANFEATGWEPSRSAVAAKLKSLGLQARRMSHKDLIPWHILPEHAHSPIYYALQAISRTRQGIKLSRQDHYRAEWLRDLLTRRGTAMVVDYDRHHGWIFKLAQDEDTDIIRRPQDQDGPAEESSVESGEDGIEGSE
jgi:hypothetical protein